MQRLIEIYCAGKPHKPMHVESSTRVAAVRQLRSVAMRDPGAAAYLSRR